MRDIMRHERIKQLPRIVWHPSYPKLLSFDRDSPTTQKHTRDGASTPRSLAAIYRHRPASSVPGRVTPARVSGREGQSGGRRAGQAQTPSPSTSASRNKSRNRPATGRNPEPWSGCSAGPPPGHEQLRTRQGAGSVCQWPRIARHGSASLRPMITRQRDHAS